MFWLASVVTKVLMYELTQWPYFVLSRPMHPGTNVISCENSWNRVRLKLVKLSCFSGLRKFIVHTSTVGNEFASKVRSVEFTPSTKLIIVGFYIK